MAGYIRQSSFVDGDTITAAIFNNEFNQLLNSFSNTTGHKHDGTAAEGPVIGLIGDAGETSPNNKVLIDTTNNYIEFYVEVASAPVQQLYIADGAIVPVTDSDVDLGTSSLYFKDTYTDTVTTTGNVSVGGNLTVTGNATISGNLTFGDADTDSINLAAEIDSDIIPNTDGTYDLGSATKEWQDLYIDGTANIDSLVADTADINGGTIDGSTIATSDITVGAGKTLDVSAGTLTLADNQISGDKVEGGTIAATTITTLASTTGNITNVNATTVDTTNIEVTNLKAKDGTAAGSIADSTGVVTLASSVLTTTDINGGTIDGTTIATSDITVGAGKTLDVSAGTLTLADNQISGDKVEGGTIAATTITDLTFGSLNDGTITVTAFVDEDNMVSDSATLVPTQQSVKAYVDSQVTAQDLDFQGDTGGALSIDLDSETLTIAGGTGLDTVGSGNTVTVNIDSTVATLTGTQTLTNKTLTTPVISSISNTGTLTLPTSTDTLVGRATTDTLTNKTLTSPVINTGVSGTAVLDDDTFATATATTLATSESIKAYVDTTVAATNEVVEDTTPQLGGDLDLNSNDITGTGNINITGTIQSSGNITGTLATAAQPNITSLGTLTALDITTSGGGKFQVTAWGASAQIGVDTASKALRINGTESLRFYTGTAGSQAERVRIDNSGNFMVGKTAVGVGTAGIELRANNMAAISRASDNVLYLNRITNDGSILEFRKDNTVVGNIGTYVGYPYIGKGDTTLLFNPDGDRIIPRGTDAGQRDAAIDLGATSDRFKDLYLSGTLTNDGTGGISIDTSGNVGIGTASPSQKLTVSTTSASQAILISTSSADSDSGIGFTNDARSWSLANRGGLSDSLVIRDVTGGADRVVVNSSGNVGIGSTSPDELLTLRNADPTLLIQGNQVSGVHYSEIDFKNQAGSVLGKIGLSYYGGAAEFYRNVPTSWSHVWKVNNSEKMRVDSSGNLLVGKTSAATNVKGGELRENGQVIAVATNVNPFFGARLGSDGDLAVFRKDSTTVGSIGSVSGIVTEIVLDPRTNGASITGGTNKLSPGNQSGALDAHLDLGSSSHRFKDLYLSGVAKVDSSAYISQGALTSSSGSVAWDAAAKANAYHVTTENTTFAAPTNAVEGAIISVEIAQGATPRTVAWNTVFEFAASTAPTVTATANKTDIFSFRYNGSVWQEIGRTQNLAQT